MKHLFNLRCLLWIAGVATFTACTDDENLLLNAKPAFDVTLDGKSILDTSTPQSIEFGRSIRFDMVCIDTFGIEDLERNGSGWFSFEIVVGRSIYGQVIFTDD